MSLRNLGKSLIKKSGKQLLDALERAAELADPKTEKATPSALAESPSAEPEPVRGLGDPNKRAQVFGRESCPWSGRVRRVFESQNEAYDYVDLDAPEAIPLVDELIAETQQNTVPYVFLRGRFIGGFNALNEIARLGQLQEQMLTAEERARKPSRIRIEVAKREDSGDLV
jgi:glutaredoxin